MPWALLQSVGLALLVLLYLLVTCVLGVLAAHRQAAVDIHDRIRESKRIRQGYLRSVDDRQGAGEG